MKTESQTTALPPFCGTPRKTKSNPSFKPNKIKEQYFTSMKLDDRSENESV
jgi:hypothetical protein